MRKSSKQDPDRNEPGDNVTAKRPAERDGSKTRALKPVITFPSHFSFGSSAIQPFLSLAQWQSTRLRLDLDVELENLSAFDLYVLGKSTAEVLANRVLTTNGADQDAALFLATLAAHCVSLLNEKLALDHPEYFRSIARGRRSWPLLVSRHPDWKKVYGDLPDRLEVGGALPLSYHRKAKWSLGRRATQVAMMIVDTINANKSLMLTREAIDAQRQTGGTPQIDFEKDEAPSWAKKCARLPLFEEDPEAWFNLGWEALMVATGGNPEKRPELRPLGDYRKRHSENEGQQKTATSAVCEANIRDGIKSQVWRAFRNMVRKKPQ